MIKRIDHVSIAARDREEAERFFVEVLGARVVWSEAAAPAGFHWTLLELGDSCLLEVIGPAGESSFLDRFLDSRGDGAHHVTLQVDDIEEAQRQLEARGVPTFGLGEPYPGWKELYIHPRDAHGILIQLAQFEPLDWVRPGDAVPLPYARLVAARAAEALRAIRKIGDPCLRQVAAEVSDVHAPEVVEASERLLAVLAAVRASLGFGRALAAPQLGLPLRLVAADLGDGPFVLANPEITWRSEETFRLWDDCLSFPELLVRVERAASVSLTYLDAEGRPRALSRLDRASSELLQHEVDHLDGVLALDRALSPDAVVHREVYEADRAAFEPEEPRSE